MVENNVGAGNVYERKRAACLLTFTYRSYVFVQLLSPSLAKITSSLPVLHSFLFFLTRSVFFILFLLFFFYFSFFTFVCVFSLILILYSQFAYKTLFTCPYHTICVWSNLSSSIFKQHWLEETEKKDILFTVLVFSTQRIRYYTYNVFQYQYVRASPYLFIIISFFFSALCVCVSVLFFLHL